MTCPWCRQDNPIHARFCLGCGARLALACGTCGAELPGGARFCLQCGQAVAAGTAATVRSPAPETYTPKHLAEKILTSKAALEGERKQVTVLFADMKGSMELLADRDPEEARNLLDPALERMMEAVHRYEGTVNQVMGDGIMALFGAPVAHEDHAVRACYAALRMQESVKGYAEQALIPLGRYHDALAVMREAEGLATRLGDPARLGRVLADISARLRNVAGEHLQAIEVGRRALAIAADSGDRELELEAQYRTGQAYFAIGDHRQALHFLSRCVEGEGEDRPSPLFASWSRAWLALTLSNLGRFADARSHAQEALRIAEGADHPFTLAEALNGVGSVALAEGDLDGAIDALERASALTHASNLQPWAVLARLGHAYALSKRALEARGLLEKVTRDATTMSAMGVGRAMQLVWLGEAYLLEGRLDDALERAQAAVSLARRHQERNHEAWSLRLLGDIASHRDPPSVERAEGYYREALALAGELGMRPLVAHCHFHLGKLFRKADQRVQAREHLTRATAMYREMDMRLWLDQAEAETRQSA